MRATETMHRIRAYAAGAAVLLGLFGLLATVEAGHAPLLIGVALAMTLLWGALRLLLPAITPSIHRRPSRARAPGVILTSTHPDAAGHARPRAPGAAGVAPA